MWTSDIHIDISLCIMRMLLDIDDRVLREIKAIHAREGRSIGAVVSELVADALERQGRSRPRFRWTARRMNCRVDLTDKETLGATLGSDGL
jgi:hypothetical protein